MAHIYATVSVRDAAHLEEGLFGIHKDCSTYNLSTWKMEAGGSGVQGHPQLHMEFWVILNCLIDMAVGFPGHIVIQHIKDIALLNGLFHGI